MEWFSQSDFFMNTVVEQKLYCENPEQVYQTVNAEIKRLEAMLSLFIPTSNVSVLNQMAGIKPVKISSELLTILLEAKNIHALSAGAFDITIAPLTNLWRKCKQEQRIPSSLEMSGAQKCVGMDKLEIDEVRQEACLTKIGAAIDLGGIAKGFAADRCIDLYKASGVRYGFINFGGNVQTLGAKPSGELWNVGIQNPDKARDVCLGILSVSNQSVVTSGGYERFYEFEHMQYHHIIDGRTGMPSSSDVKSVTVICENSMIADALSTAIFVAGRERGIKLSETQDAGVIIIDANNIVHISQNIHHQFQPVFVDTNYKLVPITEKTV